MPSMDERSRLLQPPENSRPTSVNSDAWYFRFKDSNWIAAETYNTWKVPVLCYTFALLVDMADVMRMTPKMQLFETIICHQYYPKHGLNSTIPGILSDPCKSSEVQRELTAIKARLKIIENIFALILAIPFGDLANKKGRIFVLALGLVGQMLSEIWIMVISSAGGSIPYSSIYISSILKSVGGGVMVVYAIVHTSISDVIPPGRRAQAFFYLSTALLITEIVAPAFGSMMMQNWNVYVPLALGLVFELLGGALLSMIPETAKLAQAGEVSEDDETVCESGAARPKTSSLWSGIKTSTKHILAPFVLIWRMVSGNRDVFFTAISFLVFALPREILEFLVQYTSKRFSWSLAEANYLISFRAAVNIGLFLVVLPFLTKFLAHRGMESAQIDLWIARGSSIFSIIGPVMIGLSPSPGSLVLSLLLFTFSFGFHPAIKSYATSLVLPEDVATLYASFAVIGIIGALATLPLIAVTFSLGLRIGGAGLGLPFFVSAALFLVCVIGSFCAWMPYRRTEL